MKKILIADDESNLRFILREIFNSDDYDLYEACDGEEALNLSLQIKPDIIILDVAMPKITGCEVAKRLHKSNLKSKIIMLSAKAQKSDIKSGLQAGANYYITKPFDFNELISVVNKAYTGI